MTKRYLDSNVILRYLLDEPQASSIEKILRKKEKLILLDIVFAEVIWILGRFYKWKKEKIIVVASGLLKLNNIKANNKLLLRSLEIYGNQNVKYTDAYIAANMLTKGKGSIYSHDKHFDKISGIGRIEP